MDAKAPQFDRAAEDVGNILALEHVNIVIDSQDKAVLFYVLGLGLTRDPYLTVGLENMWVNVGHQQFHLPSPGRMRPNPNLPAWAKTPQIVRGVVGLVMPDLAALERRLTAIADTLAGTRFSWSKQGDDIAVTCPWGNRIRCHAPAPRFGDMRLGMAYVEFEVAPGAADGIQAFYHQVLGAPGSASGEKGRRTSEVRIGNHQAFRFREIDRPIPDYDRHHVAIYIADFSGPHDRLLQRGLVTEEANVHEYRFQDIVDPKSGAKLFALEHEVRSMHHPMFARVKVNRNPDGGGGPNYHSSREKMHL